MKKNESLSLKEAMTASQFRLLSGLPTTHQNCIDRTGVARPGKTKRDRLKRSTISSS